MICESCKIAADTNNMILHQKCEGINIHVTYCDCAHITHEEVLFHAQGPANGGIEITES